MSKTLNPPVERHARRALLLLPIAAVTGAVVGPLQYLLFYSGSDSPEVTSGITAFSVITGAVLGVIIGGLAGAVGYLLARRSHLDVKVIAIAVTLTVAAVWAFIVFYSGAESSSPVGVADLVIPVCTALAAGSFILLTQRTKNS
ncbi:hypothetical protein [Arthrobacter flavus]|uniref:Major facilitator superfamily (MFS) profile domain-containing protein n=1 Tax=Arthrobacter flavus TaxID=95172 RepID=A0ABW4QC14_9MICC